MNTIREIEKINQEELDRGIAGTSASWHAKYSKSAWVYVGNLDHELTEGDILCVVSQFGEVEDIHLSRDEETGKSRGFAFIKYEDARSCVLAVDNFVGAQILGRSLRVDHVEKYRLPKKLLETEEDGKGGAPPDVGAGHAYKDAELRNEYNIHQGQDVFAPVDQSRKEARKNNDDDASTEEERRHGKRKEKRKRRKEESRKHSSRKGSIKRDRRRHDGSDSEDSYRREKHSRSEKKRKHRNSDRGSARGSDQR